MYTKRKQVSRVSTNRLEQVGFSARRQRVEFEECIGHTRLKRARKPTTRETKIRRVYIDRLHTILGNKLVRMNPAKTHSVFFPTKWLRQLGDTAIVDLSRELDVYKHVLRR